MRRSTIQAPNDFTLMFDTTQVFVQDLVGNPDFDQERFTSVDVLPDMWKSTRYGGAGLACIVHAAIPALFTETAGKTVLSLHDHMVRRKAGAANPNAWPDYEI